MVGELDRRSFMRKAIAWIGGVVAGGVGIPAARYVIGPSLGSQQGAESASIGSASSVPLGEPTLRKATVEQSAGWITSEQEIGVFVKTSDGREFVGLSNICTHLGCRVRWVEDQRRFYCPCHAGIFDEDGNVVSGPPPRPLDRYPITVDDGQLILRLGSSIEA